MYIRTELDGIPDEIRYGPCMFFLLQVMNTWPLRSEYSIGRLLVKPWYFAISVASGSAWEIRHENRTHSSQNTWQNQQIFIDIRNPHVTTIQPARNMHQSKHTKGTFALPENNKSSRLRKIIDRSDHTVVSKKKWHHCSVVCYMPVSITKEPALNILATCILSKLHELGDMIWPLGDWLVFSKHCSNWELQWDLSEYNKQ